MHIQLDLIQPSPRPVRSSWDEDGMNELAQSIREQGVIVPVKVRERFDLPRCRWHGLDWVYGFQFSPTSQEPCELCSEFRAMYGIFDDGEREEAWVDEDGVPEDFAGWVADAREKYGALFELVYGHRRVEAARRAGLTEVPAFIESVEDTDALIQALIENVQREDMSELDQGKAYRLLRELEISTADIGAKVGKHRNWISRCIALANDPIADVFTAHPDGHSPANIAEHLRQVLGDDLSTRRKVAQKAATEGLGHRQARIVAEAVRDAPNEAVKQALLDMPVRRDVEYWKEAGSIAASDREKERAETYAMAPAVKELLERFKLIKRLLEQGKDSEALGKMGPEHMPYIATQLRKLADWINAWANELDTHREEIVNG